MLLSTGITHSGLFYFSPQEQMYTYNVFLLSRGMYQEFDLNSVALNKEFKDNFEVYQVTCLLNLLSCFCNII